MDAADIIALVFGSAVVGSLITQLFQRKNTLANALEKAASALNITSDELVEALVEVKKLRADNAAKDREIRQRDEVIVELRHKIDTLREIARKMYERMEAKEINPVLTSNEHDLLFDTDELNRTK